MFWWSTKPLEEKDKEEVLGYYKYIIQDMLNDILTEQHRRWHKEDIEKDGFSLTTNLALYEVFKQIQDTYTYTNTKTNTTSMPIEITVSHVTPDTE
jgi:hypothetical protein